MPDNPIKSAVRRMIEARPDGLSEHELIRRLSEDQPGFPADAQGAKLGLFRKHFLVMNALYQLQSEFLDEGWYLSISPLAVRLEPLRELGLTGLPSDEALATLRDFYLDWSRYERVDRAEIESMLTRFWERYLAIDKRVEALQELGLPPDAAWAAVKQAYRRLAARHHPDKGGDTSRFRRVREAYELLLRCYAP